MGLLGSLVGLHKAGIDYDLLDLSYIAFVHDARNRMVESMLQGPWTRMLQLDADMAFHVPDMVELLAQDVDIIGAPCVKKQINWKKAAMGIARAMNPEYSCGDWCFNPGRQIEFNVGDVVEVEENGTAIMAIKRRVFEAIPFPWFETYYKGHENIGEDFDFCEKARAHGFKVHLATGFRSHHIGEYAYKADMRSAILEKVE